MMKGLLKYINFFQIEHKYHEIQIHKKIKNKKSAYIPILNLACFQ